MDNLEAKIEAVLFWKGEPVALKRLAEILKVKESEVKDAIFNLRQNLAHRGIVVQEKDGEVTLGTAPEYSTLIENLQKEELNRELSKASLETLSIVLYKNGATRAEIDWIRGVNSSFTLRALSIRGLVEKIIDPKDARRFLYRPSFELLSYMGVQTIEELPGWGEINTQILSKEREGMENEVNE